jgi:hypothetical protein
MKIYTQHYPEQSFREKMKHLSHIDFSFFLDCLPNNQDQLSQINIWAHQEPNEYTGYHDWVIKNKNLFSLIFTWSDKIRSRCSQAIFQPFGSSWLTEEQFKVNRKKELRVSHVRGNYLRTYGHQLRYEYHDRSFEEVKIPFRSWEIAGNREIPATCAVAKCELFGDAQFGVVIENTTHRGYFTEKIMEMFLLRCIPIYWGCSNIDEFFDPAGIIKFDSIDQAIFEINKLDDRYYIDRISSIEQNYVKALRYIHYEQNLVNNITNMFKLNNLVT